MAERITIAELAVDDSGVVSSVKRTRSEVNELEKQMNRSGPAFVHHLFSMRAAAGALLGAFSIAGLVTTFKDLVIESAKASSHWNEIAASADNLKQSASALVGSLVAIEQQGPGTSDWMNKLAAVIHQMRDDWETIHETVAETNARHAAEAFIGPPAPAGIGSEARFTPALDAANKKLMEQREAFLLSSAAASEYNIALAYTKGIITQAGEAFSSDTNLVRDLDLAIDALVRPSRWQQFKSAVKDSFAEVAKSMTTVKLANDLITSAVQQFATELGRGFSGAGMTFRKFIADMLLYVGEMLIAWGALGLVTAYFGYGPGAHAAAIAFAAGAAAMAASRVIGGGEQGASTRGVGGYVEAANITSAPSGPNVTINILGNVLGNDAFARSVVVDIKKALSDGAGGGGF